MHKSKAGEGGGDALDALVLESYAFMVSSDPELCINPVRGSGHAWQGGVNY